MSDLFWLSEAQMKRLQRYFSKSHGKPRVDDRRVLSGIIVINAMDYAGGMPRKSMVRTRHCTIVGSDGVTKASSRR
jgi:hypothetical protein